MRKTLLIVTILGGALVSGSAAGNAAPGMTVYGNAPIGHLQPHARQFSPNSPADQAGQQQAIYDARQQKLDEQLDKELNICRGC